MALRLDSPSSNSSSVLAGHFSAHSPQAMHLSMSTYLGADFTVAVKSPSSPSRERTSDRVKTSMFSCRPTSTSLGEMIHIEQSLVGKVLSSWAMVPPMAGERSTRWTK